MCTADMPDCLRSDSSCLLNVGKRVSGMNAVCPAAQLSISEKGLKKMVELHKHYKEQLLDPDVLASFQARPDVKLNKFLLRKLAADNNAMQAQNWHTLL